MLYEYIIRVCACIVALSLTELVRGGCRAAEVDDIMLSGVEIKKIALDIEGELFDYYGTTSANYRNKYRTILFYIKDPKNVGFFRRYVRARVAAAAVAVSVERFLLWFRFLISAGILLQNMYMYMYLATCSHR